MILCGSYEILKNVERIDEKVYKGTIFKSRNKNSKLRVGDIVYFPFENVIELPQISKTKIFAIKYYDIIYRDERAIEKDSYTDDHSLLQFEGCGVRL
jgi:hypothetical protein